MKVQMIKTELEQFVLKWVHRPVGLAGNRDGAHKYECTTQEDEDRLLPTNTVHIVCTM